MEFMSAVFLGAVVLLLLYAIMLYNNLVRLKHNIQQAWSNTDVLLKQRNDELPKLVDSCKQYMQYEQATLEQVMQARNAVNQARQSGDVAKIGLAEGALRSGLGALYAVAENYPELKASQTFLHLQGRISDIEESIADRREFYNSSVNQNNVRIEQFPDVIIARMLNFGPAALLQFDASEKADVNINKMFS